MKGLKTLAAVWLGAALLAGAVPASAQQQQGKKPPAFRTYVACGWTKEARPSHRCARRSRKGAFFRSTVGDVPYAVCVKFPGRRALCAPKQEAVDGKLFVNRIRSNIPGLHRVTWFVKGKRVGRFFFFIPRGGANRR